MAFSKPVNYKYLFHTMMEQIERHAYENTPMKGDPEFAKGWKKAHRDLFWRMIDLGAKPVSGYGNLMAKKVEPEVLTVEQAKAQEVI